MKAIMCSKHGDPSEVCECVDIPNPGNPKPNEINVQMLASAINPADLLAIQGLYQALRYRRSWGWKELAVRSIGSKIDKLSCGDMILV